MLSFIYDDQGNHLTQDDNGTTTVGLFNAVNEQTKRAANDVLYDARGNLTKDDAGKAYFYDRQNMLTRVDDAQGGQIMRYAYDVFNRLVEREGNWPYSMQYDYDGWRRLEECPGDDPGAHRGFVWAPAPGKGGYIDDLICLVNDPGQSNVTYFACRNHNFSVVALLTSGGAVLERYDYNPYGERLILDADYAADADGISDIANLVGHQGLYHDIESGFLHIRTRYYDLRTARFGSRDSIEYTDGCSLYQYIGSQVLRWVDPYGYAKQTCCDDTGKVIGEYDDETQCCEGGSIVAKVEIGFIHRQNSGVDHADVVFDDGTLYGFFTDDKIHKYNPSTESDPSADPWFPKSRPYYCKKAEGGL